MGCALQGARAWRLALAVAIAAPGLAASIQMPEADAATFGVSKWEAGTCTDASCTDGTPSFFYTQAAGHPNFGITDFRFASEESSGLAGEVYRPIGHVRDVRVDLPVGLAVNPEATPTCSEAQIQAKESLCPPASQVGEEEATGTVDATEEVLKLLGLPKLGPGALSAPITVTEKFPVYDLERKPGQPARFGVEVNSPTVSLLGLKSVIYLEGGLSWYHEPEAAGGESSGVSTGDYHEYFEIRNIPEMPELVESKLIFWGRPHEYNAAAPERSFITMPSACEGPQTTLLHVDSHETPGQFLAYENTTPVGVSGCGSLEYEPTIALQPETTQSDAPDGPELSVHVPQTTDRPSEDDSPDLRETKIALPEGMTLDPSAANGLQACSDSQFKLGTDQPIECPPQSILGTVAVDAPGIPAGSLTGEVYLGTPKSSDPASGQEYRVLLGAQAPAYGVGLRLEGKVSADPSTGRLTATFSDLPPVPFEELRLKLKGGPTAPLANPLACGAALTLGSFLSYSGRPPATPNAAFGVDFDGRHGVCPAPLPFGVAQSTTVSSTAAGSSTSLTLSLARGEGQQYIAQLSTMLPAGLIGLIPAVPRCGEADASTGNCPAATEIGTAGVTIGSGPDPLALPPGPVYLTGPYDGAPFGLAVVTNAEKVGPFDYGTITTRAKVEIDPYTARVSVVSQLPVVVGGAPVRLRSLEVTIDRPRFLLDPTSCRQLGTDTRLTSTFGLGAGVSSPFQASGCGGLGFEPTVSATTDATTSRREGASLKVSVSERRHQADIRSVEVTLPKRLVARLATLNHACLESVFAADPSSCPEGSKVGSVRVTTPALPGVLRGGAYFVSQGGAAFPDLDLVLEGDGVTVILVGDTEIKGSFTYSRFPSLPDVPIDSFALSLPRGPYSALSANAKLCPRALYMPTTITGQNGKVLTRRTRIHVAGCKKQRGVHERRSKRRHRRRGR
jgi:hypothetical protein